MRSVGLGFAAILLAGCATVPQADRSVQTTASTSMQSEDARVAELLAAMSLEHKVGQLIQPQINSFTAEDMRQYRFGSYLNGGNGGPYGDEFAPAEEWLRLADEMWEASTAPLPGGEPAIPTLWGTDAVHGHTNVVRATIFPHNIGLGATGDPDLVRRIGGATAAEIEVTGIDWNFSPTVAVAQDDRWGRTYESYSEDPQIVATMGAALVEGLQGRRGASDHLGTGRVIATAKHFFGDGGTEQGVDQGDVNGDIEALKAIHAVPYPAAIAAGVETVMASFNSINGRKMHGNEALLTGVLRGEMGFDGLVVGDWNGHGQVAGCTVTDCPQALMAGLDIYMVPDDWKGLYETLLAQVKSGVIPEARLNEAVERILRVKYRAGLLSPGASAPSKRGVGGRFEMLGSADHRAIGREAVAKSQVILKNSGVLPVQEGARVLVAGKAADSIAQTAGGWTLTWQGGGELTNDNFPGATSIWRGIEAAAAESGGSAKLSPDGSFTQKPDVAIVVFGEEPYAEFAGDRKNAIFADEEGLRLLRSFDEQGIPTVAVFLSGRPLWMNREINASDAFVASWLPGSEGAGVADVLFGAKPASGRLSFSWPAVCAGEPVNSADKALFPLGYGLSFDDDTDVAMLDETCGLLTASNMADLYSDGRLTANVSAFGGNTALPNLRGEGGGITAKGLDRNRQEDAREIAFASGSRLTLAQEGDASGGYMIEYSVTKKPTGTATLIAGDTTLDVTDELVLAEGKGWREMLLTDACLPDAGERLTIASEGTMTMQVSAITRRDFPEGTPCSF